MRRSGPSPSPLPRIMLWYVVFGAIHELGHVLAAFALMLLMMETEHPTNNPAMSGQHTLPVDLLDPSFWYGLILERQVSIDISSIVVRDNDSAMASTTIDRIHHAGWILSLCVALFITASLHHFRRRRRHSKEESSGIMDTNNSSTTNMLSSMQLAAWLTAVEAIATDLLGISGLLSRLVPSSCTFAGHPTMGNNDGNVFVFWCGNFGILLLHHLWLQDRIGRDSALDCLEQMVQITMMRGAQSGGVVTFQPSGGGSLKGIRKRVVNKKRTDLSKELRKRIHIPKNLPSGFYPFLAGHTRFATTSKATLDGTHPHQWTPPTQRHIFDFDNNKNNKSSLFKHQSVENFISHNGDLEFYQLNGKTYEVETILQWLGQVLKIPAPASVDSMAIAGLIDVIRCQGCFALAARYAMSMGMTSSTMDVGSTAAADLSSFPSQSDWENIGAVFEECWTAKLSAVRASQPVDEESCANAIWSDSITMRVELTATVTEALRKRPDLVQPLKKHILLGPGDDKDEEKFDSLYAFCMATIHAFLDNDLFYSTQLFLKHAKGSFGLVVSSSFDAHRQLVIAARGQTVRGISECKDHHSEHIISVSTRRYFCFTDVDWILS